MKINNLTIDTLLKIYEKQGYSKAALKFIYKALQKKLDVSKVIKKNYNYAQMSLSIFGFENEIEETEIYVGEYRFEYRQMSEIVLGKRNGVDYTIYAKPQYNYKEMRLIRTKLEQKLKNERNSK